MPKSSSSEIAYTAVKERILDGALPGGELVSEGQIAEELGMRLYPKRGALVVAVAKGEMLDVVRARHLVELDAVGLLAEGAPGVRDRLRETLSEIVTSQVRALEADDTRAFSASDADFHRGIVAAGGNRVLGAFYESLRDRQRRMTSRAARRTPERLERIVEEHRELADLACSGDAAGFGPALWTHISLTHDLPDSVRPATAQLPATGGRP